MVDINDIWATAVAPPTDPKLLVAPAFIWSDFFGVAFPFLERPSPSGYTLHPACAFMLAESFAFLVVALIKVADSYIGVSRSSTGKAAPPIRARTLSDASPAVD